MKKKIANETQMVRKSDLSNYQCKEGKCSSFNRTAFILKKNISLSLLNGRPDLSAE